MQHTVHTVSDKDEQVQRQSENPHSTPLENTSTAPWCTRADRWLEGINSPSTFQLDSAPIGFTATATTSRTVIKGRSCSASIPVTQHEAPLLQVAHSLSPLTTNLPSEPASLTWWHQALAAHVAAEGCVCKPTTKCAGEDMPFSAFRRLFENDACIRTSQNNYSRQNCIQWRWERLYQLEKHNDWLLN